MQKPAFFANLTRAMGLGFLTEKILEYWNDGILEYWTKALFICHPIIPLFHYSIIPFFSLKDYPKPLGVSIRPAIGRALSFQEGPRVHWRKMSLRS